MAVAKSVLPAVSFHSVVNALWGLTVPFTAVQRAARKAFGGLDDLGLTALATMLTLLIAAGKLSGDAGLRIH